MSVLMNTITIILHGVLVIKDKKITSSFPHASIPPLFISNLYSVYAQTAITLRRRMFDQTVAELSMNGNVSGAPLSTYLQKGTIFRVEFKYNNRATPSYSRNLQCYLFTFLVLMPSLTVLLNYIIF